MGSNWVGGDGGLHWFSGIRMCFTGLVERPSRVGLTGLVYMHVTVSNHLAPIQYGPNMFFKELTEEGDGSVV